MNEDVGLRGVAPDWMRPSLAGKVLGLLVFLVALVVFVPRARRGSPSVDQRAAPLGTWTLLQNIKSKQNYRLKVYGLGEEAADLEVRGPDGSILVERAIPASARTYTVHFEAALDGAYEVRVGEEQEGAQVTLRLFPK